MKKGQLKVCSILLSFALLFSLLPTMALAAAPSDSGNILAAEDAEPSATTNDDLIISEEADVEAEDQDADVATTEQEENQSEALPAPEQEASCTLMEGETKYGVFVNNIEFNKENAASGITVGSGIFFLIL